MKPERSRRRAFGYVLCLSVLLLLCGCSAKRTGMSALLAKDGEPSVTVCIDASAALAYPAGAELSDGVLFPETAVRLEDGEDALTLLRRITQATGMQTEVQGGYVEGIGNLYEFDCGGESGWVYTVNGVSPPISASSYRLQDGDVLVWKYITSLEERSWKDPSFE